MLVHHKIPAFFVKKITKFQRFLSEKSQNSSDFHLINHKNSKKTIFVQLFLSVDENIARRHLVSEPIIL